MQDKNNIKLYTMKTEENLKRKLIYINKVYGNRGEKALILKMCLVCINYTLDN